MSYLDDYFYFLFLWLLISITYYQTLLLLPLLQPVKSYCLIVNSIQCFTQQTQGLSERTKKLNEVVTIKQTSKCYWKEITQLGEKQLKQMIFNGQFPVVSFIQPFLFYLEVRQLVTSKMVEFTKNITISFCQLLPQIAPPLNQQGSWILQNLKCF